jgi:hypothetical protein
VFSLWSPEKVPVAVKCLRNNILRAAAPTGKQCEVDKLSQTYRQRQIEARNNRMFGVGYLA